MVKNTIQEALVIGTRKLKAANIENPNNDAILILANILGKSKEYIFTYNNIILNNEVISKFSYDIEKRANNVPLQYITNKQEFMGLEFYVDENTLIPRADTETLVEYIINYAKDLRNISILDLCTGSGCIAISLAHYLECCKVVGVDISVGAVKNSLENAKRLGVQSRVQFRQGDLFDTVRETYDIIVSNPPYIERNIIDTLEKEVKNEPLIALDGGEDGLDFYRIIISQSNQFLKSNGLLAVEIGYNQGEIVKDIFAANNFNDLVILKDLSGNNRVVAGFKS